MANEQVVLQGKFVEVPPPDEAPVQSEAEKLGLVKGLRVEIIDRQWRCTKCSTMQPNGSAQVWVPDSVLPGDPEWSVTEACRQNACNGYFSAWCLKCAPKAKKVKPALEKPAASLAMSSERKPLLARLRELFC